MDKSLESPFLNLGKQIIDYLPSLLAGAVLLLVGWLVGWLAKRITVQLMVILRFERLFVRLQWRRALSRADIRYAVFNLIGNIVFFLVILIFLNSALDAMKLSVLSNLIQQGVVFIPKLIIALLIFSLGWIIASRVSSSVYNALLMEELQHYSIFSRFVKFVIVLFFSSMALIEVDIAPQIVVIGFTTIMITLGIILIILFVNLKLSAGDIFNNLKKNI